MRLHFAEWLRLGENSFMISEAFAHFYALMASLSENPSGNSGAQLLPLSDFRDATEAVSGVQPFPTPVSRYIFFVSLLKV